MAKAVIGPIPDAQARKRGEQTGLAPGVSTSVCSPLFRPSASVVSHKAAFATRVPPNIYSFHRYTGNSAFLSYPKGIQFHEQANG